MDRVHSTSTLPQRRWGSNAAQDQRSVRPTTASQYSGSRPMSSRPISGYGNRRNTRPTTALTQKPPPLFLYEQKLGSSTQLPSNLRPASAVRPLSGRIFLRKTQEKGWIAKNVPEMSYEGLEVEDYDDFYHDDTESVDSFFDDDFDTEEQDEKLQRLLTCTTLGVASKGRKQDYVSGEVMVPKFHCPRCRDHYYGLTPYPCDEELARLIREGLWQTGQGASPDKSIRRGMMRASLSETNVQRNRKSSSSIDIESSSKIKLPPLNTNNSNMTSSRDAIQGNKDGLTSTSDHNKKKKKISFALDSDCSGASPSTSEASLTGHDSSSSSKGRKRRIGDKNKKGSLGSNKGSLTGLSDTNDLGSNSSLDRYRTAGHQKKSDNQSSTSKLIESHTDTTGIILKNRAGLGESSANKNGGKGNGSDGETASNGKGTRLGGTGLGGTGSNADISSATMLADKASMTGSTDNTGGTNSKNASGGSDSGHSDSQGSKYGNKSSNGDGNKKCNVVNCQNSTNFKSGVADGKSSDAEDGNKKKAPAGYMRAASPSQSEWSDPTHAKKWINNVAPPHPTFRYNNDNDDYDDDFSSQVFNPRGRYHQKKPASKSDSDDPLLLPVGPRFTRAFTFSYMPSDTSSSSSSSAAVGGKKASRKKTS